jgi:hypothetical protein
MIGLHQARSSGWNIKWLILRTKPTILLLALAGLGIQMGDVIRYRYATLRTIMLRKAVVCGFAQFTHLATVHYEI